jgi:hypothetical protein
LVNISYTSSVYTGISTNVYKLGKPMKELMVMKLTRFGALRLVAPLLLLFTIPVAALAQETAMIKLESLDKLAVKASEVVRKEEEAKGGGGTVHVRCFEFGRPGEYGESDLVEVRAQLRAPSWSRFMRVDDREGGDDETVEIYLFGRPEGGNTYEGMTIIASEPKELTVVNIIGRGSVNDITKRARRTRSPK